MVIGQQGRNLIAESEGIRLYAYPDPGTGDEPWTIGIGSTSPKVHPGDTITIEQAWARFDDDIKSSEDIIAQWVTHDLNQGQYDAICSFVFNLGPGAPGVKDGFVWLKSGTHSTLLRSLNAGAWDVAANQFPLWANPPLPGLVTRRNREQQLFRTGVWS